MRRQKQVAGAVQEVIPWAALFVLEKIREGCTVGEEWERKPSMNKKEVAGFALWMGFQPIAACFLIML
jgi:hypothetical protein